MSASASIEYATTRAWARLAERPDDRLWHQLRADRSVAAMLDAVRASPAAPQVAGIDAGASSDDIELAFRQQFRLRVDEAARWAPDAWVPAVRWTRLLPDLPAIVYLATGHRVLPWMRRDPDLAAYTQAGTAGRRAALLAGPLAPLADALVEPAGDRQRTGAPHPALDAWERRWRSLWPAMSAAERGELEALVRLLARRRHEAGAAGTEAADAGAELTGRVARLMHAAAAHPAALFAWLALLAFDLERLRGEFVIRALDAAGAL